MADVSNLLYNIYRNLPIFTKYPSLKDIYCSLKNLENLVLRVYSDENYYPAYPDKELRDIFRSSLEVVKKKMRFDGVYWRLVRYYDSQKEEIFEVQPVNYSIFLATNRNPKLVNMSYDAKNPFVYTDLANSIGSNVCLVLKGTDDKYYTIVGVRSRHLAIYPELYGTPAGMCEHSMSFLDSILKEIKEEIKTDIEIKEVKGTYLGRNVDDLHPELLFLIEAEMKDEKSNILKANWEYKNKTVKLVEIGSEEHISYLTTFISHTPSGVVPRKDIEKYWIKGKTPKWVPAQWIASALSIEYLTNHKFHNKE